MCGTAGPGEGMSVLGIYNSTAFGAVLEQERNRFLTLYKRRAMLHHYTEFMEQDLIANADETVATLIHEYQSIQNHSYIKSTQEKKTLFPSF